jgi:hypothetical protein
MLWESAEKLIKRNLRKLDRPRKLHNPFSRLAKTLLICRFPACFGIADFFNSLLYGNGGSEMDPFGNLSLRDAAVTVG